MVTVSKKQESSRKDTLIWISVSVIFFLGLGVVYGNYYSSYYSGYYSFQYLDYIILYLMMFILGSIIGYLSLLFKKYWSDINFFHVTKPKVFITLGFVLLSPIVGSLDWPPRIVLSLFFIFSWHWTFFLIPIAIYAFPAYLLSNLITCYSERNKKHSLFTYSVIFFLMYFICIFILVTLFWDIFAP